MTSPYAKSPPPAPADAEVVRNIEVLAAFVAKTGVQFEQLARTKTAHDPKFGFLLDGSAPGSEAARAQAFYQWKKQRLEQRVFASDGSDDVQLKICAMVDDDSKCSLPSDAHAMDSVKPLLSGAAEKKESEGSKDGARKAETLQVDDLIKKPRHQPHHRTRDDTKPSHSTAPHKRKSESISVDRSKNGEPLADSVGRLQKPPRHESLANTKQPPSTVESKKTAPGASQDNQSSRSCQPQQGARGDSQEKKAIMDENAQKTGSSKDDPRKSPTCPSGVSTGVSKASGDVEPDHLVAEATEKHAKEIHGLRLLKAALADYVKEVLKPAWKEGNMSKEAFKSIVKKVVDKVAGSLQAHQIPKSQENVDQYMAQSQTKIAKLVQGYLDRFKKN